uniref:UspA domain-containing protein n=1 Tax=Daucus carota subsp. sativus TaxID=79200 RepID=A0A165WR14_DAUCS
MAGTRESEIKAASASASSEPPTRVMMGVNESTIRGFDEVDSIYASPEDFRRLKRRDRIRGHDLLEYFVACEAWIKRGDPKEVICHEVTRVQPDLLVVGSRGLGPFQRVFVGTVSEFCAKHAECPVVTIKRSAEETPQDPVDD